MNTSTVLTTASPHGYSVGDVVEWDLGPPSKASDGFWVVKSIHWSGRLL